MESQNVFVNSEEGFENVNTIQVFFENEPFNFLLASLIRLELLNGKVTIDSQDNSDLIDTSEGEGIISFKLSSLNLWGDIPARLIVVDENHPNGQVVLDSEVNNFRFLFL